jgi:hypothetical protein
LHEAVLVNLPQQVLGCTSKAAGLIGLQLTAAVGLCMLHLLVLLLHCSSWFWGQANILECVAAAAGV